MNKEQIKRYEQLTNERFDTGQRLAWLKGNEDDILNGENEEYYVSFQKRCGRVFLQRSITYDEARREFYKEIHRLEEVLVRIEKDIEAL